MWQQWVRAGLIGLGLGASVLILSAGVYLAARHWMCPLDPSDALMMIDGVPLREQFPVATALYLCLFPDDPRNINADRMNAVRRAVGLSPTARNGDLVRPHFVEIEARFWYVPVACQASVAAAIRPP